MRTTSGDCIMTLQLFLAHLLCYQCDNTWLYHRFFGFSETGLLNGALFQLATQSGFNKA